MRYWLHERAGLPVFLPKVLHVRKRSSKRVTVIEPLFPSYLFVRMPLDPDPLYTVKWAPGVKRIVANGEVPTPVPIEVIDMLRERCSDGEVIHWRQGLRTGATVHVVHGPFAGLQGILERPSSRSERVQVLLQSIGSTSVEVDVVDIEMVS